MIKYYLKEEFEINNTSNSLWVSIFRDIYDLTDLINNKINNSNKDELLKFGGKELNYMFDNEKNPKKKYNFERQGYNRIYNLIDNLDYYPNSDNSINKPWWKNYCLIIGKLSKKERQIRIINTLTHDNDIINVPCEENLNEIQQRYIKLNFHSKSYTWKNLNEEVLDMRKTLNENGIKDETEEYEYYEVPDEERYIPVILLFYNDDLTIE